MGICRVGPFTDAANEMCVIKFGTITWSDSIDCSTKQAIYMAWIKIQGSLITLAME